MVTYAIEGGPYFSKELALQAAIRTKSTVLLWALRRRIGIDFSLGEPDGFILEQIDTFSLQIRVDVFPRKETPAGRFAKSFNDNFLIQELKPKQLLAIEIYTASYFDSSARSQFVTRISAVEALMVQEESSQSVRTVIENLQEAVRCSNLSNVDEEQLVNALSRERRESKTRTGAKLAQSFLKRRKYHGMSAYKTFTTCYDIRSKIVHSGDHNLIAA